MSHRTKDSYLENMKSLNKSIKINKKRSLNRKMVKRLQWHLTKEDVYIANKYRHNCLVIIREIKIQMAKTPSLIQQNSINIEGLIIPNMARM